MKKFIFFFFLIMVPKVVLGSINEDTIIYCDNSYYGYDNNWYKIEKDKNRWTIISKEEPSCINDKLIKVKFNKCIDGDTVSLIINNKKERVRLLAIDTPESVKENSLIERFGKEASEYTCNLVKKAKVLEIEYDNNSDKTDKYDRPLVYLYADGKMVQKELLKKGYAKVSYLYDEYKYTIQLKSIEEVAKKNKLGIWEDNNDLIIENEDNNDSFMDIIIDTLLRIVEGIIKFVKSVI